MNALFTFGEIRGIGRLFEALAHIVDEHVGIDRRGGDVGVGEGALDQAQPRTLLLGPSLILLGDIDLNAPGSPRVCDFQVSAQMKWC